MQRQQFSNAKYTKQDLIDLWKQGARTIKRVPLVSEFKELGIPHRNYYNRAWGSYTNFKQAIGVRNVIVNPYKKKVNPKRFFKPKEWTRFINGISNNKIKFIFEFLMHTGMRFDEAAQIKLQNIDLENKRIDVLNPKGGKEKTRTIPISSYLCQRIKEYVKQKKITPSMNFKFPSNKSMNDSLKRYCQRALILDYEDFSCHNLRKTLEMYGCGLNVNSSVLSKMLGHTVATAESYYISSVYFNAEEKTLIRSILDDLWL